MSGLVSKTDETVPYTNALQSGLFGRVVANGDPEGRGRIKVRVPQYLDTDEVDDLPWAYPLSAYYNPAHYHYDVPSVGSRVRLQFVDGDVYATVYSPHTMGDHDLATLFLESDVEGGEEPPAQESHIVHSWDNPASGEPSYVRIRKDKPSLELHLESERPFTLRVDEGRLYIDAPRGVAIRTEEDMTLDARSIAMGAEDTISISAPKVDVEADDMKLSAETALHEARNVSIRAVETVAIQADDAFVRAANQVLFQGREVATSAQLLLAKARRIRSDADLVHTMYAGRMVAQGAALLTLKTGGILGLDAKMVQNLAGRAQRAPRVVIT